MHVQLSLHAIADACRGAPELALDVGRQAELGLDGFGADVLHELEQVRVRSFVAKDEAQVHGDFSWLMLLVVIVYAWRHIRPNNDTRNNSKVTSAHHTTQLGCLRQSTLGLIKMSKQRDPPSHGWGGVHSFLPSIDNYNIGWVW